MAQQWRDGAGTTRAFHCASSTLRVIWTRSANSHQAGGCVPAASKAGRMTASDHAQQRSRRFPLPGRGVHRWKAVIRSSLMGRWRCADSFPPSPRNGKVRPKARDCCALSYRPPITQTVIVVARVRMFVHCPRACLPIGYDANVRRVDRLQGARGAPSNACRRHAQPNVIGDKREEALP
jgi:hypothetical protein